MRSPLLTMVATLVVSAPAAAHQFWIEPPRAPVAPGERVALELRVGDGFPGETYSRNPAHLERFAVVGPDGERPVPGRRGDDPAGRVRVTQAGHYQAVYTSSASLIEMGGTEFDRYLAAEGLDHVLAARREAGLAGEPARELYARCAKTMFPVGTTSEEGFDRAAGLELELIPETDPSRLRPGDTITLSLLHAGEPLAGATLHAFRRGDRGVVGTGRTDAEGRARFALAEPGVWLFSTVHMRAHDGPTADWESVWSSLTFVVNER